MAFNDTSASEEKQSPRSSVRAWCTIGSISFVIALLASVAVWYLFLRGGNNDEEREAFDRIMSLKSEGDTDLFAQSLNEYLDTYNSDAYHFSQLKALGDRFFTEQADWNDARERMTVTSMRHFLASHPEGFFHVAANKMLDSISFSDALRLNEKAAFQAYLNQFVQGTYRNEAEQRIAEIEKLELSDNEKTEATHVLASFFNLFCKEKIDAVQDSCANDTSVSSYASLLFADSIPMNLEELNTDKKMLDCRFAEASVQKVDTLGMVCYQLYFTLEREFEESPSSVADTSSVVVDDAEKDAHAWVKTERHDGAALLSDSMKIISVSIK